MTAAPSALLSRCAALAILVVLVGLPLTLVLGPVVQAWTADRATLAAARTSLEGFRRVAASRPLWEARVRALEQAAAGGDGLIAAAPAPAAIAALQGALRQLVQASGGEVRQTQPGGAVAEHGLERIEAGFDLTLPSAALPGFLEALDAHDPYLFVDRLELTQPEAAGKAPAVTVHLQLRAYRRPS